MSVRLRHFALPLLATGALLIAGGAFWTLIRGQFELPGEIALGAGLVALAAYVALEPGRVRAALTGRTARQGGNAAVVSVAVIGILVLVNVLAARHHRRFDLTEERQFSLSPQSRQVLAALTEPISVTAFMTPSYWAQEQVRDLLKEYAQHTTKLRVEYVDPDQRPALARQFGITRDGTLIFQAGERHQEVLGSDEQAFTSAIVKVTRDEVKKIYFLTGHRERDPEGADPAGYEVMARALERDNYQVATLNLAAQPAVPDDAAALVIAAPMVSPTADAFAAINTFVDRGGSLFVLADPSAEGALDPLLERWGLAWRADIIIDPASSFFGDIGSPVASRYPYHDITRDLAGLTTFFPLTRSISQKEEIPPGVSVTPLVQTSQQSWGETNMENRQVRFDEGKDMRGPLNLAVAAVKETGATTAEGESKRARLVVLGDADFASNDVLESVRGTFGNADFFLNAVSWLAEEESLISIRPAPPVDRMVILTAPQVRLVMYTGIIFLPALVVVAGVWVWWRRR